MDATINRAIKVETAHLASSEKDSGGQAWPRG